MREVESFDKVFRVGDKVLQLVNLPEENVYNGDIGEITAIQFAKENDDQVDKILPLFDQTEVEYHRTIGQQLTLAYCCSIHKAQGSEFKMVILPMVNQYHVCCKEILLYTAVTKKSAVSHYVWGSREHSKRVQLPSLQNVRLSYKSS